MNSQDDGTPPVASDPRVLIIVANWNGRDVIGRFIETILSSTYQNLDVLVVDNASSDGSCEIIEGYPSIDLMRLAENRGWGCAMNAGLVNERAHDADYFIFMNNDVFMEPEAITALVRQGEKHPEFGILSPILLDCKGKLTHSGGFFTNLGWWRRVMPSTNFESEKPDELDIVIGATMFVRAGVVDSIGGFDPEFFLYREDVDYCKRAREAGFRIGVVYSSRAVHIEGATTRKDVEEEPSDFDSKGIYAESFVKYVFKHLSYADLIRWLFTKRGISSWGLIFRNYRKLMAIRRRSKERINPNSGLSQTSVLILPAG